MEFSIGEKSKLHNISIQTLRYYDKIGLLKPAHINEENNYRYYTIDQFIVVDMIKHCKLMGLSLEEIKALIGTDITPESIYKVLNKQQESINQKIKELEQVRNHIDFLKRRVGITLESTLGKVLIEEYEDREFISYNYRSENINELEINLRKALIDVEKKYGILNSEIIFTASYKDILQGKIIYSNVMIYNKYAESLRSVVIPKGRYLSLYYDDSYTDNLKYYKKVLEFARENNIELSGDFYEFSIMPKIDKEGREKSLVQLIIKIKE